MQCFQELCNQSGTLLVNCDFLKLLVVQLIIKSSIFYEL